MTLLHNTLACGAFRKRERHDWGSVELGRSCSDLSRVTQRAALLSPCLLCLTKGIFLYVRALRGGLTFQIPSGAPFQTTVTHFHPVWAFGAALTALRNVQLHLQPTSTPLKDPNPGISTQDPPRVNVPLFSATVQNQALPCHKPLTCQTPEKPLNFLSRSGLSHIHALGCSGGCSSCIWNIPLEKPGLPFELYRSRQTKSFPIIWRGLLNPSVKFQLHNGNISEIQSPGKLGVVEVLFLLH